MTSTQYKLQLDGRYDMKEYSRQYCWQSKRISQGKCRNCGKEPLKTKWHCEVCAKKKSTRSAAYYHRRKKEGSVLSVSPH